MLNFKYITVFFLCLFAGLILLNIIDNISIFWYILLLIIWLLFIAIGSFVMSWDFYLKAFTHNPKEKSKRIAITFDDGPHPKYTKEVLKLLKAYNAKATFFCVGHQVEKHAEILNSISEAEHLIGNHSYSHSKFIDFKSTNGWISEIQKTDEAVEKITGKRPTYFRPPFGVTTPHLAKAIKSTGHSVIGWNIRSFDTALNDPKTIQNRIIINTKPGAIILLHDNHSRILSVLEHLLQFLKKNDYEIVTINELFHEK